MKTGLFFGSFNPIHIGHTAVANYIVEMGGVDELWFVVSPQNPHKQQADLMDDRERLDRVRSAVGDYPKFRVCDIEFSLPKPSYTIDTLRSLSEKHPDRQFSLILGSDSLTNFDKWKDYKEILAHYPLIIYPRVGYAPDLKKFPKSTFLAEAPLIGISATFIREQTRAGYDLRFFVP